MTKDAQHTSKTHNFTNSRQLPLSAFAEMDDSQIVGQGMLYEKECVWRRVFLARRFSIRERQSIRCKLQSIKSLQSNAIPYRL